MTAREQLDALGRPVASLDLSLEDFAEKLRSRGLPADAVASAVAGQAFVRAGHSETVFDHLPVALGRPARSFADCLGAHAKAFR